MLATMIYSPATPASYDDMLTSYPSQLHSYNDSYASYEYDGDTSYPDGNTSLFQLATVPQAFTNYRKTSLEPSRTDLGRGGRAPNCAVGGATEQAAPAERSRTGQAGPWCHRARACWHGPGGFPGLGRLGAPSVCAAQATMTLTRTTMSVTPATRPTGCHCHNDRCDSL